MTFTSRSLHPYLAEKAYIVQFIVQVLPLENEMREPKRFPDVVKYGMTVVMVVYISMGTFGYLTCTDHCEGSITLNLPGTAYVYILIVLLNL
jgi:proton-coupled amino acid transporter